MKAMLVSLIVALLVAPGLVHGQATTNSVPDWGGVWQMVGPTVFDAATVDPPNGRAGDAGVREHPPYTQEWEALYLKNIDAVRQGRFPDPVSICGTPHGFPRIMNLPDVYEFVVKPEQVWILAENGPNIMRIYTDGRKHPAEEDMWPTYNGDSVGHWEGDTLVFETVSLRGASESDTIIDRTGLVLSDKMRAVTRMRKIDDTTLEAQIVLEDAKALKAPWHVTKRYRRQAPGMRVYDYACAENNRNPISPTGRTLTLGSDGKPVDRSVD